MSDKQLAQQCVSVLRTQQGELVQAFLQAAFNDEKRNKFNDSAEILQERITASLDLLIRYLEGKSTFKHLYIGQELFQLYDSHLSQADNLAKIETFTQQDKRLFQNFLVEKLPADAYNYFEARLQDVHSIMTNPGKKHVNTLFIGDCLLMEVVSFLVSPALSDGISINPFPIHSRDPHKLQKIIQQKNTQSYDIVFFSPFSYGRLPEYEQLLNPKNIYLSKAKLDNIIANITQETAEMLDLLANLFECPIFIHNSANIQRSTQLFKLLPKHLLTLRNRVYARNQVKQWLMQYITDKKHSTDENGELTHEYEHLHLLDEHALLKQYCEVDLGLHVYPSKYQHATVFSEKLALEYHDILYAFTYLQKAKLVICDLDNTLWDGIIGEGEVQHYHDRQQALKALKSQGVVLSICSKNDPKNVHFTDGTLQADDFVDSQISWEPKTAGIARTQQSLNLQFKHFVFVDDRPDERERVKEAFPDVLVMDATDTRTWKLFKLWAMLLDNSTNMDRTQLYKEKKARDDFEKQQSTVQADPHEFLRKQQIKISLRQADKGQLKRVEELINRTNQWNLCGSRTTFKEVKTWHQAQNYQILVANVADRFGDMGLVCAAIVKITAEQVEVPIFVLSCRVFGYGVETVLLNYAKRLAQQTSNGKVVGFYQETAQNHPCKDMYTEHGFNPADNGQWIYSDTAQIVEPDWVELADS